MPDISFRDFNPKSFEQFSQALCSAVFGHGLKVFGDGPDGGREAEYDGTLNYPTEADRWKGLTVVQAKFRQRTGSEQGDAPWLVNQLVSEAKRYREGYRTIPDQYLLITNVRLSGADAGSRTGGQTKVRAAYEEHLRPLGIKEFDVWHEEKIATLLDNFPDLLRSYAGFLGNREVLEATYRSLQVRLPDFHQTMRRYLVKGLQASQSVRLQQAGHVHDGASNIEELFVDLPFLADERGNATFATLDCPPDHGRRSGTLARLLTGLSTKLSPSALTNTWTERHGSRPDRYLLVGGPGQGKSTVTQFLGQVMRYRILARENQDSLAPEIRRSVVAIGRRLEELSLPDGVGRYPIAIDLPQFVDEFVRRRFMGDDLSILDYVTDRIAKGTSTPGLDTAFMRQWLAAYPFLFMLDGLDEVPPSGARREVVEAITRFWDEVGALDADVAMTVTTRPQGYNDDLAPDLYLRMEMTRLAPEEALAYAQRVAAIRIPDEERRTRVVDRLRVASNNEATALLMISPLQVAILFQIIEQRGTAPTDRWTLFAEYLSVIIKREQEKIGSSGELLREHETLIRQLLARVGLVVHVEAERNGGSAYLTPDRLQAIARDLLQEAGFDEPELGKLVAGILYTTTDRLVFLEQRVEGRLEFDVRSLQEFMAASELLSGPDEQVQDRLRIVAGRAHWQHVYRIAASKAFAVADAVRHQDTVVVVNRELDSEDHLTRAILLGATTSLDLLADGLAHGRPKTRRTLTAHALELLRLGCPIDLRLSRALRDIAPERAGEMISPHMRSSDASEREAAWATLLCSIREKGDWADELALEYWPTDEARRLELVSCGQTPPRGTRADGLFRATLGSIPPARIRAACDNRNGITRTSSSALVERFRFMAPFFGVRNDGGIEAVVLPTRGTNVSLRFTPIENEALRQSYDAPRTSPWRSHRNIRAFVHSPGVETAARFCAGLSDPDGMDLASSIELPWPLASIFRIAQSVADPSNLVDDILAGRYGTGPKWEQAEKRLANKGVTFDDLEKWRDGILLDDDIADVGIPFATTVAFNYADATSTEWLSTLRSIAVEAPTGAARDLANWILGFVYPQLKGVSGLTYRELDSIARSSASSQSLFDPTLIARLEDRVLDDERVIALIADLGERNRFSFAKHAGEYGEIARRLPSMGDREGLLVAALALVGRDGVRTTALSATIRDLPTLRFSSRAGVDAASALLAATEQRTAEVGGLASSSGETVGQHALLGLARMLDRPTAQVEEALVLLSGNAVGSQTTRDEARMLVRQFVDRRQSTMPDRAVWNDLRLPSTLHARLEMET